VSVGTFVVPHLLNVDVPPFMEGTTRNISFLLVSGLFLGRIGSLCTFFSMCVSLVLFASHICSTFLMCNHIYVSATHIKN
jgi:hypothetical protein